MNRACVWLTRESDDKAWLVLAGNHGWLHTNKRDARDDARWLARNLGLPVREEDQNRERIAS
jgi:hypothetical protein